jgi:hypothetical protein
MYYDDTSASQRQQRKRRLRLPTVILYNRWCAAFALLTACAALLLGIVWTGAGTWWLKAESDRIGKLEHELEECICEINESEIIEACNATCVAGPPGQPGTNGTDGINGTNGTDAEECDKALYQMIWAEGDNATTLDNLTLSISTPGEWVIVDDPRCRVISQINITHSPECGATIEIPAYYEWLVSVSFTTLDGGNPEYPEVAVGLGVNFSDPTIDRLKIMHGEIAGTITFELIEYFEQGTTLDIAVTNLQNTQDIQIQSIHLSVKGAYDCAFAQPGPQGPPGVPGLDGIDCWDLNENYICDLPTEDKNNDGVCNVLDCAGPIVPFCDLEDIFCDDLSNGTFIQYNGSSWTSTNITYTDISGDICPALATASIECLEDVDTTGVSIDEFLVFNGTSWISRAVTYDDVEGNLCNVAETTGLELGCLSDVSDDMATNSSYLCYNSTSDTWQPGNITFDDVKGDICPILDSANLACLGDVDFSPLPSNGDLLAYFNGSWQPSNVSFDQIEGDVCDYAENNLGLGCLQDVDTSGASIDEYLCYDGSEWVSRSISYSDIDGNLCNHIHNVGVGLDCLSDTDVTGATDGQFLSYNASISEWVPADISFNNFNGSLCNALGSSSIGCLGDVNLTGVQGNDVLLFDNSTNTFVPGKPVSGNDDIVCSSSDLSASGNGYVAEDRVILLYTMKELEGSTTHDVSGFSGTPVDLTEQLSPTDSFWNYPNGIRVDVSPMSSAHGWRSGLITANNVTDAIKASGEYSVEVWLTVTDTSQDGTGDPANFFVIGKNGGSRCDTEEQILSLGQGSDDLVWRLPSGPACNDQIVSNIFLENHLPIHIVVTFDGLNTTVYKFGREMYSATTTSAIASWTDGYEVSIFNNPWLVNGDQEEWDGILQRIAVWDKALTQSEVIQTFKLGPNWPRECTCDCQ